MVDSGCKIGKNKTLRQRLFYLFLVFITGLICVYDTVLSICFASGLLRAELNPLCNLIINNGGVKLLIIIKSTTTIIGILILIGLSYTRFRVCVVIMFVLALFLFFYLTFYPLNGDYTMSTIIHDNINNGGPISHFIEFYRAVDIEKAVDNVMEGNL
tara:strand:- start:541 stop:1011 length:471 start_codon:yes stop_codon:yes gene_type:complete